MHGKKMVLVVCLMSSLVILSSCADAGRDFQYEGIWGHRALVPGQREVDEFLSITRIEPGVYLVISTSFYESLANDRALGRLNEKGELVAGLWGTEWIISGATSDGHDGLLMYSDPNSEGTTDYYRVKDIPAEELVPKKE